MPAEFTVETVMDDRDGFSELDFLVTAAVGVAFMEGSNGMAMTSDNCGALIRGGVKGTKAGLLKDTGSRIGRVLKQNKIKDADNRTHERKLVPRIPKATDPLTS